MQYHSISSLSSLPFISRNIRAIGNDFELERPYIYNLLLEALIKIDNHLLSIDFPFKSKKNHPKNFCAQWITIETT